LFEFPDLREPLPPECRELLGLLEEMRARFGYAI